MTADWLVVPVGKPKHADAVVPVLLRIEFAWLWCTQFQKLLELVASETFLGFA